MFMNVYSTVVVYVICVFAGVLQFSQSPLFDNLWPILCMYFNCLRSASMQFVFIYLFYFSLSFRIIARWVLQRPSPQMYSIIIIFMADWCKREKRICVEYYARRA